MMARVYELWLTSKASRHPFAVLIEDGEQCAWTLATDTEGEGDPAWSASIVGGWDRNDKDTWVLDAWRDYLEDLAAATPEERLHQLKKLDQSTAGIAVRRPRNVPSRLPPHALAYRWRRNRLGNSHDVVAEAIAARLGRGGKVHWRASIDVGDGEELRGEWIVETDAQRGGLPPLSARPAPHVMSSTPVPSALMAGAAGLAVVSIVEAHEVDAMKMLWAVTKSKLANEYPFGIAVVRDSRQVEILDQGCVVGARFTSPVAMAVATARYQWNRARWPGGYGVPLGADSGQV